MEKVFDLEDFEEYREDNRREVKAANGGLPKSLWDSYSSLANSYGGCIICGVVERKDGSWKTTGLKDVRKLKKDFWDTIHNKTKVSINLLSNVDVEDYEYHGDVVLVIKVPRASHKVKPVYINNDVYGGTYRRDWEGDYLCERAEVNAMIRDSSEESPDMKVLRNKRVEDFDKDTVHEYRVRYNLRHEGSAWSELSDEVFLVQIGAADDESGTILPTAAGLLMFGKAHRIVREYSEFFLDYREHMDTGIRWTDRIESNSPDWPGNVFSFFSRVSAKITRDLAKPFKLEKMVRVDDTPAHKALREALVNCLVNTDFYQSWSVVIEKYPDRIMLANPGTIPTGKKQMLKGGISQPRNKALCKMFSVLGYGEHAGSGVPDIYKVWSDAQLDRPIVEEQFGKNGIPDRTTLTLPLIPSSFGSSFGTNTTEASTEAETEVRLKPELLTRLLEYCKIPRSRAQMQDFCEFKSEKYFREHIIKPMLDEGLISRTIPEKPKSPNQKYVAVRY